MKGWFLFAAIILMTACSGNAPEEDDKISLSSDKDYAAKQTELNAAIKEMNIPLEKWNGFMQRAKQGQPILSEDFDFTYAEFLPKADAVKKKTKEIKAYLSSNGQKLTESGIDVNQERHRLEAIEADVEKNINSMKAELNSMSQQ
ncbi:hypothetical protein JXB27_04195 [Candidatus Woesearchaeota archaeon]|nr:hypothetical protein [Candidatus Woesearchaeota archaeon]